MSHFKCSLHIWGLYVFCKMSIALCLLQKFYYDLGLISLSTVPFTEKNKNSSYENPTCNFFSCQPFLPQVICLVLWLKNRHHSFYPVVFQELCSFAFFIQVYDKCLVKCCEACMPVSILSFILASCLPLSKIS